MKQIDSNRTVVIYRIAPTSLVGRIIAFVVMLAILLAAFFLSIVIFLLALVIVFIVGLYLAWHRADATARPPARRP